MSTVRAAEHPMAHETMVDIAVPIYNESRDLEANILRLRTFLNDEFPFPAVITIVDNASTDTSWEIAARLAREVPGVRALHLDVKGRGRALRAAWSASDADIVAYMDVDLSTSLDCLLPLIAPLASGHSAVVIGSRLAHGARVLRGPKREVISRVYNMILHVGLRSRFSDAQCGFKALRAQDAQLVLPLVVDNEWFFDTEMLVVAQRAGLRISEVPVDWSDDPRSSVHITNTAIKDLKGVWRLLRTPQEQGGSLATTREPELSEPLADLVRFSRLGLLGASVYVGLFLILSQLTSDLFANAIALMLSVGFSTVVLNHQGRRLGRRPARWPSIAGTAVLFGTSVITTTVALAISGEIARGSPLAAIVALGTGAAFGMSLRFLLCRGLTFRTYLEHLDWANPRQTVDRGLESQVPGRVRSTAVPLSALQPKVVASDNDALARHRTR